MTLSTAPHTQRSIHMHIMARQIQTNQALKHQTPARESGRQEHEQTGSGAAIGDHIEDGAKFRGLTEVARGEAIEGVEQTRDGVEEGAGARVQGHVVEGEEGEKDAGVACGQVQSVAGFPLIAEGWMGGC